MPSSWREIIAIGDDGYSVPFAGNTETKFAATIFENADGTYALDYQAPGERTHKLNNATAEAIDARLTQEGIDPNNGWKH